MEVRLNWQHLEKVVLVDDVANGTICVETHAELDQNWVGSDNPEEVRTEVENQAKFNPGEKECKGMRQRLQEQC